MKRNYTILLFLFLNLIAFSRTPADSLVSLSDLRNCNFDRVEDVDLLGQLSRSETNNFDYIGKTFQRILYNLLYKQNDLPSCTVAYNRLLPQIHDVLLANEISYTYYITVAFCSADSYDIRLAVEALKLKPNDKAALTLINMKLNNITHQTENEQSVLDTLICYEKEMNHTEAEGLIQKAKLIETLDIAKNYFQHNQLQKGIKFISLFETSFPLPLPSTTLLPLPNTSLSAILNISFKVKIENAYYDYARYYMRINNRIMAQKIVDRGLNYIPKSNMIQTATYVLPVQKPRIFKQTMTKAEYDKYMKQPLNYR